MKFRNYCIVVMGNMKADDVLKEITNIAENKPNMLNAGGIIIATFTSVGTPSELNEQFKSFNRSFLLFDLNPESSGFNITKKEIHDGLFGFLNDANLNNKTDSLINLLEKTTNNVVKKTNNKPKKNKISEADITNMTLTEKNNLFDSLIDKGVANLTEHDKKILQFLAKKA